jgi:hypothetical protein
MNELFEKLMTEKKEPFFFMSSQCSYLAKQSSRITLGVMVPLRLNREELGNQKTASFDVPSF